MISDNLMNPNMTTKDMEDHIDMLHCLLTRYMIQNNLSEIRVPPPNTFTEYEMQFGVHKREDGSVDIFVKLHTPKKVKH